MTFEQRNGPMHMDLWPTLKHALECKGVLLVQISPEITAEGSHYAVGSKMDKSQKFLPSYNPVEIAE